MSDPTAIFWYDPGGGFDWETSSKDYKNTLEINGISVNCEFDGRLIGARGSGLQPARDQKPTLQPSIFRGDLRPADLDQTALIKGIHYELLQLDRQLGNKICWLLEANRVFLDGIDEGLADLRASLGTHAFVAAGLRYMDSQRRCVLSILGGPKSAEGYYYEGCFVTRTAKGDLPKLLAQIYQHASVFREHMDLFHKSKLVLFLLML